MLPYCENPPIFQIISAAGLCIRPFLLLLPSQPEVLPAFPRPYNKRSCRHVPLAKGASICSASSSFSRSFPDLPLCLSNQVKVPSASSSTFSFTPPATFISGRGIFLCPHKACIWHNHSLKDFWHQKNVLYNPALP